MSDLRNRVTKIITSISFRISTAVPFPPNTPIPPAITTPEDRTMSKASRAQYQANRNNAKHAHGPTSPGGKHRSSQNALRHGLTGRVVVLPTEDMEAYQKFSKELVDSLHPETPMETQFAQSIADTQWRLNRARTIEDGMLAMGNFEAAGNFTADSPDIHAALTAAKVFRENSKDFVNLSLYEQRLSRAQKEAFRQLRELQAERKAAAPPEPNRLVQTAAASPIAATASEPFGFVYSSLEKAPLTREMPCRIPEKQAA
jgi:hypothetical protein